MKTAGDIIGLGSLAIVIVMTGYVRHLKAQLKLSKTESDERLRRATNAENAAEQFDGRISDKNAEIASLTEHVGRLNDNLARAGEAVRSNEADAIAVHEALEITNSGDTSFWCRPPLPLKESAIPLELSVGCPTLLFANQKGGVGKTTAVVNVAAYFAWSGKKVLVVDMDYQGSTTALMQLQELGPPGVPAEPIELDINSIIGQPFTKGTWTPPAITAAIHTAWTGNSGALHFVVAGYDLAQTERREEYRWTLGRLNDDPRYRLATFLHAAREQLVLDYILIDAPPRFTMGFINGLCAATHLFVPTVVDGISTRSVETFAIQFSDVRRALNPNLHWAGIIGMMTTKAKGQPHSLPSTLAPFASSAENAAKKWLNPVPDGFLFDAIVPRDADISASTDTGISFLQSESVRNSENFKVLGDEILRRVHDDEGPRVQADASKTVGVRTV